MTPAERKVIELAAALPCQKCGTSEDPCNDSQCLPCHASQLLPTLWCLCKNEVLAYNDPVYCSPHGVRHTPEGCGPITAPAVCHACKQPLASEAIR